MIRPGRRVILTLLAMLSFASASSVRAAEHSPWWSVGVVSGATAMDRSLADYQWDTRLRAAFGAEALVGHGRWSAGARLWRTQTTQTVEASGVNAPPIVRATSFEAVGRIDVASWQGLRLEGTASAGRRHLGYTPDELLIDSGSGNTTPVTLAPINEWVASAGLSMAHSLPGDWDLGLQLEHAVFGLDTAHRVGAGIETGRESFGEWNARLALAKRFHLR